MKEKVITWTGPQGQECSDKLVKGHLVTVSPFVVHHQEKFWKNPEDFDPERWLSVDEASLHPCSYIPFGAGVRRCNILNFLH